MVSKLLHVSLILTECFMILALCKLSKKPPSHSVIVRKVGWKAVTSKFDSCVLSHNSH